MIRCTTYHRSGTRSRAAEYARARWAWCCRSAPRPSHTRLGEDHKAAVLDGEVVASDADGHPNFARLHVRRTRPGTIHLRVRPTCAQRPRSSSADAHEAPGMPEDLLERFGCPAISLSEPF